MTFIGQFIDHDLTLDATSPLGHRRPSPRPRPTAARPSFDLDSLYGSGPFGDPLLYEADKLRLKAGKRAASSRTSRACPTGPR